MASSWRSLDGAATFGGGASLIPDGFPSVPVDGSDAAGSNDAGSDDRSSSSKDDTLSLIPIFEIPHSFRMRITPLRSLAQDKDESVLCSLTRSATVASTWSSFRIATTRSAIRMRSWLARSAVGRRC